jgi:Shedu protein SduA, C-terminal
VNILVTGNREPTILTEVLRKMDCSVEFLPLERLVGNLKESRTTGLAADAIVTVVHPDGVQREPGNYTLVNDVAKTVRELRNLDSMFAMKDGRKWSGLPVILILSGIFSGDGIRESIDATVLNQSEDYVRNVEEIRGVVSQYRQRLLDELDNLGLLVSYEHGRYRVGPALTPRDRDVEGEFYYGPADTREGIRGKYFTLDRDNFGIQYEIELFEALINKPDVRELDLQEFFEEHPHFLIATRLMQALPHVSLVDQEGKLLVPDFVLKPIVAAQRDSNWEILDLKHPQAKLLAGPSNHVRFSQDVMKAINQVKDYKDHFEDPRNAGAIAQVLGHALKHPKLGVLIGRMPESGDVEALEVAQSRETEVRIVTYDEILETQKKLVR